MAAGPIGVGHHGGRLAEQITRLRTDRDWDQRALAARIAQHGRTISASVLGKIEAKSRRVDVDDLVAIAAAFGIGVGALLGLDEEVSAPAAKASLGRGTIEAQVAEDLDLMGDLAGLAPTLAELALRLAREIDDGEGGRSLPSLARELREVVAALSGMAEGDDDDDDDFGDLGTPA